MRLILLSVFAVAYFRVISAQNCVGRVRSVSAGPTSTYGPACVKPALNKAALPAEEFASILQLVNLLSKAQSPPPPPPPPPTPVSTTNNPLNSGGIIDKLIDALIITATQKNQPAPSSSRLIDIDVLKSLLNLQGSSSSASSAPTQSTPAALVPVETTASVTASPASSVPLTTSSTSISSVLQDSSGVVGGNPADSLSSLSTALRTLLNPET